MLGGVDLKQRGSARLGLADVLVVGDLRNLLPALDVAGGVFIEAAEDALGSLRGERHAGKVAMEGAAASGSLTGIRSAMGEFCQPPSLSEARPPMKSTPPPRRSTKSLIACCCGAVK